MHIPTESLGQVIDWRDGSHWSGAEIAAQATRTAHHLKEQGIGRGDRVVLWHGGTGRFFGDLMGVWQTGACAVCLNPSTTPEELGRIVGFVGAQLVIDDGESRLDTEDITARIDDSAGFPDGDGGGAASSELDDDALILFTSGTTGTPKGVVHTHRSLLSRIALNQAYIPFTDRARTLSVLPTHFGHGLIGNCLTVLLDRQSLLLAPGTNLDVVKNLGAIIDTHEITFMSSVPTMWKRVLGTATPPTNDSLVRVHVGSAPLSAELWNSIADWAGTREVVNMYGITETANWIAGASLADHDSVVDGLVGEMWGGSAAVLDANGVMHGTGEGELLVQSPSLMKDYFELPAQTDKILRQGWFHTGDIGRIDADGTIYLTGRQKYEINRGGIKVHPEDIDLLLERHADVGEACAFALPDDVEGEIVAVAVTSSDGSNLNPRDLRRWCAERLAREKIPSRWFVVDDIPKTDRGKINRDHVAAFCLEMES